MPAEGFAAISAVLFAGSHVVSKKGMRTTNVIGGLLVSLSTGLTVLIIVVLLNPPSDAPWELLLLVAASGMLAPALARAAAIAGVDRLGPTVSVPIQSSVYPLFAVFGASLILGEPAGLARWAGVGAIVLGVWFLALRGVDISAEDGLNRPPERGPVRSWLAGGLLFPVIAGLGYGGADLIRKQVIVDLPHPAFASLVAVATALAAWCTATAASSTIRRSLRFGRSTYWFMLGGGAQLARTVEPVPGAPDGRRLYRQSYRGVPAVGSSRPLFDLLAWHRTSGLEHRVRWNIDRDRHDTRLNIGGQDEITRLEFAE